MVANPQVFKRMGGLTILVLCAISLSQCAAMEMYPITEGDKKFLSEIVEAVRKKDAEWIASRMVYPISLVTSNGTWTVKTKEQFRSILARNLTEFVRAKIVAAAAEPLFKSWRGVMVGDGIIWFSKYEDEQHTASTYGIFALGYFAWQPREDVSPELP